VGATPNRSFGSKRHNATLFVALTADAKSARSAPVELWLLVAWALSGAALLFTHVLMAWRVFAGPLGAQWRYLGFLVPFLTPIVAWRGGNRLGPITWLLFLVIYLSARMVEV